MFRTTLRIGTTTAITGYAWMKLFKTFDNTSKAIDTRNSVLIHTQNERDNEQELQVLKFVKWGFSYLNHTGYLSISNNHCTAKNVVFDREKYEEVKDLVTLNDCLDNLDIIYECGKFSKMENFLDEVKYNVTRRMYDSDNCKGWGYGMAVRYIESKVKETGEKLNFENGADVKSKFYQNFNPNCNFQIILCGYVNALISNTFRRIGLRTENLGSEMAEVEDGHYFLSIQKDKQVQVFVLTIKDNEMIFFDPNYGETKLNSLDDIKNIHMTKYGFTDITFYKITK